MKRFVKVFGCAVLLLLAPMSLPASAQPGPPGQPQVIENSDCSITVSWAPAIGATTYSIIASFNGTPVGVFPVGGVTTIRSGPIPSGTLSLAIIALGNGGQTQGAPNNFIHTCGGPPPPPGGAPGQPTWVQATASGNTVTLVWTNGAGAAGTELEGTIQATGQVLRFQLPAGTTSVTFPGVPTGNFIVRLRNFNNAGFGPYSEVRLVVVGVTLGTGDMQVTLTWNTTADIDLHVVQPGGACESNWHNRSCGNMFLDVDDTNGFGPENIFVRPGSALAGIYQVYVVNFAGPATTVTVSITLYPGSSNPQTTVFTMALPVGNSSVGFNIATVDVLNRTITGAGGTRPAADETGDVPVKDGTWD